MFYFERMYLIDPNHHPGGASASDAAYLLEFVAVKP